MPHNLLHAVPGPVEVPLLRRFTRVVVLNTVGRQLLQSLLLSLGRLHSDDGALLMLLNNARSTPCGRASGMVMIMIMIMIVLVVVLVVMMAMRIGSSSLFGNPSCNDIGNILANPRSRRPRY